MSFQLDLDVLNSKVNLTLSGPSDRWFSLGFNSSIMAANVDCVVMTSETVLSDSYFPGSYVAPNADTQNNWILTSNVVNGTIRTVTAYRDFHGDATDFIFSNSLNNLNLILAYSYNPIYELYDPINSGHGGDNYGYVNVVFTNLSDINYSIHSYKVDIVPNPVKESIHLFLDHFSSENIEIKLFDINYKIVFRAIYPSAQNSINIPVNNLKEGQYYLNIKSESFELLKKILICD